VGRSAETKVVRWGMVKFGLKDLTPPVNLPVCVPIRSQTQKPCGGFGRQINSAGTMQRYLCRARCPRWLETMISGRQGSGLLGLRHPSKARGIAPRSVLAATSALYHRIGWSVGLTGPRRIHLRFSSHRPVWPAAHAGAFGDDPYAQHRRAWAHCCSRARYDRLDHTRICSLSL
jgi:hypothetical protein